MLYRKFYRPLISVCCINIANHPHCKYVCSPIEGSHGSWNRLFDNAFTPFFGFFMSVWAVLYFEYWKRRSVFYAHKWAAQNFEETEMRRYEFHAIGSQPSPITGKLELYFPETLRKRRQFLSLLVVLIFAGIVILSVLGQVALIAYMQIQGYAQLTISFVVSLIGLISIQICRRIFQPIARRLNHWENYRTASQNERALIFKTWVFEFCNIYAHIIYL
jgi:hypothetical protein